MSRLQEHVGCRCASLTKMLLADTLFLIEHTNSHCTPFCRLPNINSNFLSFVLRIMIFVINAERLSFSSLIFFGHKITCATVLPLCQLIVCFLRLRYHNGRYRGTIFDICLKYAQYMPKIYLRYAWRIPDIYLRNAWDIPRICLR